MTDNGLGLRRSDPIKATTIDDVPLPASILDTLQRAADNASLTLSEAVAQILIDRCLAAPAQPRRAPAKREPKQRVRSIAA